MDASVNRRGVSKTPVRYAIRNAARLSEKTRKRVLNMVPAPR